jgi:hypothetical protein
VLAAVGALTAFLCGSVMRPLPAQAAPTSTVVTIRFDDGTAEQLDALPILQA